MPASHVPPEYTLEPLPGPLRREDVHFAVLGKLPRASEAERAFVAALYDQAARIQGPCWNEPPFEWVPPHCLQAADAIGGSTLAAYVLIGAGEALRPRLVGMVFELPAFERTQGGPAMDVFLYSHLMAVDPCAGNLAIGHELKRLQRREALSRGITTIRWTYDPLQSLNANLNIRKCGAFSRAYKRGAYSLVGINEGVEADRFYVTWELAGERVRECMEAGTCRQKDDGLRHMLDTIPCVNETRIDPERPRHRINARIRLDHSAPLLALEIPINFQDMILTVIESAQRWRRESQELFEGYLEKGYVVRDFLLKPDADVPGAQRAYYLLDRNWP